MDKETTGSTLPLEREPHYEDFDSKNLRLFRDDSGRLRLTIEGDRSYVEVKVVRAFPISEPDRYFGILDGKSKVIGTVVEPKDLDEQSRHVAFEEVRRHYFTPTISRVHKAKEEFGAIYFDVDTDYGRREFVAKGIRDNLQDLGDGHLIFSDVDGNRYRIEDWQRLDTASRRLLERLV